MIPFAEPLADMMMKKGRVQFVDVRHPRHDISGYGHATAYDVFADDNKIGVLDFMRYIWAMEGSKGPQPERIAWIRYSGDVPGYGKSIILDASEFPEYRRAGATYAKNPGENFTQSNPLFRLDDETIKFVTHETDGKDRADRVRWVAEMEKRRQTPSAAQLRSIPEFISPLHI